MKPFDLEAAKAGAPIQRRHGQPMKFVAHVPDLRQPSRVIATEGDMLYTYYEDGHSDCGPSYDLFMAPATKTYWVNVYTGHDDQIVVGTDTFDSEHSAKRCRLHRADQPYLGAYKIEVTL